MPVMKISPIVRRKEQHQRNIHRLMHEGREVEVMRRRGVATVMDTSEEGDEEDEEGGMAGVVFTGASIQQAQSALNERAQMQAKQEFAMLVAESSKAYQEILHQQHLQLQQQRAEEEQRRRNSWPKQQQTTTGTGTGAISYANVPLTLQQQQQHRQAYLQQQAQQQQKLIQLQQQHQHQLQFQQQKQLLLHQQQQLQQQIQQQQLYKQRMYASSNPAFNTHAGFPSPHPQAQQQQQLMQIQTPQQRGANALNFVKTLDQNNAATTASNWSYASQHAASTGRLSLY
ncbi:hypothetical protein BGW39_000765 [Mortierella sp. 14UC]|nr:hypothetical protein BGW39_000765 [Mortierella sp. 14UC]